MLSLGKKKETKDEKNIKLHNFLPIYEGENEAQSLICHIENGCNSIGLIGGYATGKSSIIKVLEDEISSDFVIEILSTARFEFKNKSKLDSSNDNTSIGNQTNLSANSTSSTCTGNQANSSADGTSSTCTNNQTNSSADSTGDSCIGNKTNSNLDSTGDSCIGNQTNSYEKIIQIQKILIHQLHLKINEHNFINSELRLKRRLKPKWVKLQIFIWYLYFLMMSPFSLGLEDIILLKNVITFTQNVIYLPLLASFIYIIHFLINSKIINTIGVKGSKINIENNKMSSNEYIEKETQLLVELFIEYCNENKNKNVIFVIEDVDRYQELEVLQVFYHINSILKAKKLDITFIYALDPQFIPEDATKFFDAIVDVLPFYDKTNAGKNLQNLLIDNGEEGGSNKYNLEKKFSNNITQYIEDIRQLKRIINLYKKYVDNGYEFASNEKKFAIATLKILYPEYLQFKPSSSKDDLEALLELLSKFSKNSIEILEFVDSKEYIETKEYYSDEDYNKVKVYKEKLKNKKIYPLIRYLFQEKLLDTDFKLMISNEAVNYSNNDKLFFDNYINKSEIPVMTNLKLDNVEKFIEDYITVNTLKNDESLISNDILHYLINNIDEKNHELLNALIKNIFTNINKYYLVRLDYNIIIDKYRRNNDIIKINPIRAIKLISNLGSDWSNYNPQYLLLLSIIIINEVDEISEANKNVVAKLCPLFEDENFRDTISNEEYFELCNLVDYKVRELSSFDDKFYNNNLYKLNSENILYVINKNKGKTQLYDLEKIFGYIISSEYSLEYEIIDESFINQFISFIIGNEISYLANEIDKIPESAYIFSKREILLMDKDLIEKIIQKNMYKNESIITLYKIGFSEEVFLNCDLVEIINQNNEFEEMTQEEQKILCKTYLNLQSTSHENSEKLIDYMLKNNLEFIQLNSLEYKNNIEYLSLIKPSKNNLLGLLEDDSQYLAYYAQCHGKEFLKILEENRNKIFIEKVIDKILPIDLNENFISLMAEIIKRIWGENQIDIKPSYNANNIEKLIIIGVKLSHRSLIEYANNSIENAFNEKIMNHLITYSFNYNNSKNKINYIVKNGMNVFNDDVTAYILMSTDKIEGYEFEHFIRDIEGNYKKIKNNVALIIEKSSYKHKFAKFFELRNGKSRLKIDKKIIFSSEGFQNSIYKQIAKQLGYNFNSRTYMITQKK